MWNKLRKITGIGRWIIPITVFLMVLWTYAHYNQIEEIALDQIPYEWEQSTLFDAVDPIKQTLYQNLQKNIYGEAYSLLDWIEITGTLTESDYINWFWSQNPPYIEQSYEELTELRKQELTQLVVADQIQAQEDLMNEYRNLQYFVMEHESGETLTNSNKLLEQLSRGQIGKHFLNKLVEEFRQVVIYKYNDLAQVEISFILDPHNKEEVFDYLEGRGGLNLNQSHPFNLTSTDQFGEAKAASLYYNWLPIENTTFVFGVPHHLVYEDVFLANRRSAVSRKMQEMVMLTVVFTVSVVALVSFLVPVRVACQGRLLKWLLRFPMEIMPFYLFGVLLVGINLYGSDIMTIVNSNPTLTWSPFISRENIQIIFFHLVGIFLLGTVAYVVVYLKNLFKQGFKSSLRNNSLIVGSLYKIFAFFTIDLKRSTTKILFWTVSLQFLIINFIFFPQAMNSYSSEWFVIGGIVSGIYSILLFFILSRKLAGIRDQYLRLFEVTHEMSNGNLDVQIEEDLGIFDSIKNQLAQIKNGFKKAVENETISQQMKTDLIANVSHDLKTPLTSIITYIDLLKDESLAEEKRQQYLTTLEQKSNRLKVLIEDLFEMSKVSSGDIKLERQEIDVVSLMKQTLMELEDKINEVNLMIRPNFPDQKVKLLLDGERTYRVFENLILNMVKYALPNTRAYLDIMESDEQVTIMLRNISASEITHSMNELTERFVRGDQSRHTDGSGLGLAIAKSIVELQNGTFHVQVDGDLFKVMMIFNK